MLRITKKREDHIVFFNLSGSINASSQNIFKTLIVEDKESSKDSILMDFEDVSNVSSSGVGILVTACMEFLRQGRIVKFVHISLEVLEKLDLNKVLPVFNIFTDTQSAVKQSKIDIEMKGERLVRLFERINIKLGVRFRIHKRLKTDLVRGFQDAFAMNLTKRGMFIKTDEILKTDTLVDVKLSFGEGFFKKETVRFLGKVVRRIEAIGDMAAGFALIILHMDAKDMECLEDHLKKYESKKV